jgi:two-component system, OmpR family, sensor histidine kinase KdpD
MPAASTDSEGARPAPEALLREAERAARSRFKVFVGAAPGVGKTYAMLEAAWERKREGRDVVVGVVETHGRRETEELLAGLEVIPRRRIEYRGRTLEEMDLDAVLARRPEIVLVDELAHTNVAGSRHSKRYADVGELLEAGVEVYSTINVQHLESLNDVVAQITGVRVRETVPDGVLERADEIKLIDLPPEDLLKRLHEGKVYVPAEAERAREHYFSPGNLTALRELALRHTAERVDDDVQAYMRAHAIAGPWAVTERLMVCVGDGSLGERLVRAARRMAARRRAAWLAVFVETPAFAHRSEVDRHRVVRTLQLAEQLGAEPVTITGQSVAAALVRYARERNVTELVLGKSRRSWWRALAHRSPIGDVIRQSGEIDVRVISAATDPRPRAAPVRRERVLPAWSGYGLAGVLVALAGAVAHVLAVGADLADPAMVFLTAVLITAVIAGLGPSVVAALASVLVYDFFFVSPLLTFNVTQPQDVLSLVVFLVVAILTSQLTARARAQADLARQREARTAALYAFARQLAGAAGLEDLAPAIAAHLTELFKTPAVVFVAEGERLALRGRHPADVRLDDAETAAAIWVWRHNEAVGPGTETLAGAAWLLVPMATARGVTGVLGVRTRGDGLPVDQRQLLGALAGQAAVAVERTRIDAVLAEKAKTEAVIEAIEDGLIVLDAHGTVEHVNEVACAILGVERGEALGARFADQAATHPHYLRLREAVRDLQADPEHERDRVEITLFLRGRDHHYVLRPTRLGGSGGLILTLQDVTYLRDQEARRENLVATLSHELRTPLTSLRIAMELLRRGGALADEQRKLVDAAHEDVLRLQDVAQGFLDLARTRAMSIALTRTRLDLHELTARVCQLFEVQAREKGVTLEREDRGDGNIVGDETKLTWALSNLVANALRYTPPGGQVRIGTEPRANVVLVSVSDTGPGIPRERQEHIFERFAQFRDGGEIGGAGLGLAIVRDIVQAHGGRVFVSSDPGRETRFTLELPRS